MGIQKKPTYVLTNTKLSLVLIHNLRPKDKPVFYQVIKKVYKASDIQELPDVKADAVYVQRFDIKIYRALQESLNKSRENEICTIGKQEVIQAEMKFVKNRNREAIRTKIVPEEEGTVAGANTITEKKVAETKCLQNKPNCLRSSEKAKLEKTRILEKKEVIQAKNKIVGNRKDKKMRTKTVPEEKDKKTRTNTTAEKRIQETKLEDLKEEKARTLEKEKVIQVKNKIVESRKDEEIRTKTMPEKQNEEARWNTVTEKEAKGIKAKVSEKKKYEKARHDAIEIKKTKNIKYKHIAQEKENISTDKFEDITQRHADKHQINKINNGALCGKRKKREHDQMTFENHDLPKITNLKYCVKSDFFGIKENVNSACVVEFRGSNVLKGLELLVKNGMADNPLPKYLYEEPRNGKTNFAINL